MGSVDKNDGELKLPGIQKSSSQKYVGKIVSNKGTKALMEACKIDDYKGAELLLKNGANPNAVDFNGQDALYYCVKFSSSRCL